MVNYVIAEIGGKQIWLEPGKYYDVNRLNIGEGENLWLRRVLLLGNEKVRYLGQPYIQNAKILVEVIKHIRGPKIVVYKMKPKKKYHKKQGHRQNFTRILIKKVYFS